MFGRSFRILRIFGIDIEIDLSWLIIFGLIFWSLSGFFNAAVANKFGEGIEVGWLAGFVATVLFFASLVAHELSHSLVARRFGAKVHKIHLFIFGGASMIDEGRGLENSALKGFLVAFVGPLTSFCLAVMFYILTNAPLLFSTGGPTLTSFIVLQAFAYLAFINFMLSVFNLLPAFPLDGGRVLVAVLRMLGLRRRKATLVGASVGIVIAIAMIILGIIAFFVLQLVTGLWLALIGWFLAGAAAAERKNAMLQDS